MFGGIGSDTLYLDEIGFPLGVDLTLGAVSTGGMVGRVAEMEHVLGTRFGDTMNGDAGANWLTGGDSTSVDDADRVDGGGEDDVLVGGPDNDTFIGGNGTDSCDGGPGTDTQTMCETLTGIP